MPGPNDYPSLCAALGFGRIALDYPADVISGSE